MTTSISLWIGLPARYDHNGYQHDAIAHTRVNVKPRSVSGVEAPVVLKFAGNGDELVRVRRHFDGDYWAPLHDHQPRLVTPEQAGSLYPRQQITLSHKLGLAGDDATPLCATFGCDEMHAISLPKGARIHEGWEAGIPAAVATLGANLAVIDGHCFRRSGVPVYTLEIGSGRFMQVSIADSRPTAEGSTQTSFALADEVVLRGFCATFASKPRALRLPEIERTAGHMFERDDLAPFAIGVRAWLVKRLSNTGFGNLPSDALRAGRALVKATDPIEIVGWLQRLGTALDVDVDRPLIAVDEVKGTSSRYDYREVLRTLLRLPLVRIRHQWPQLDFVPEADEEALEMI